MAGIMSRLRHHNKTTAAKTTAPPALIKRGHPASDGLSWNYLQTSQALEVMNKAHIITLAFRTTFRICFKISIHEQMGILGKVPDQPGADSKNLFFWRVDAH